MIDFDALVLHPAIALMGEGVVIYPEVSRPGIGPFNAVGVYSSQPITVEMQDGQIFSDQQTRLGVRVKDFKHMPGRGDRIKIVRTGERFWIGDIEFDGQGGAAFPLHHTEPT